MSELTNARVNRAGQTLRRTLRGELGDTDAFWEAYRVLLAFRAAHQQPLTAANMGLRSMVKTVGCDGPEVSQRLKRVPTILDKITREPTLALANMQDIGGCRAVLQSIDEVYLVQARLQSRGRVERISDYIAEATARTSRSFWSVRTPSKPCV
jgi:(p)ppGpp synthase/HD superfamily hydrolase